MTFSQSVFLSNRGERFDNPENLFRNSGMKALPRSCAAAKRFRLPVPSILGGSALSSESFHCISEAFTESSVLRKLIEMSANLFLKFFFRFAAMLEFVSDSFDSSLEVLFESSCFRVGLGELFALEIFLPPSMSLAMKPLSVFVSLWPGFSNVSSSSIF
jgi:hypothetical protein